MKYFLDTEFIETQGSIDLISIGLVCEDGRTFYAESTCFDETKASEWVKNNVIKKLKWCGKDEYKEGYSNDGIVDFSRKEKSVYPNFEIYGKNSVIANGVKNFLIEDKKPEFWAYYAAYDWVVFCWLFGTMMDLPRGFPMYCRDIKQWADQLGVTSNELPKQEMKHNALEDAKWNKKAWEFLDIEGWV